MSNKKIMMITKLLDTYDFYLKDYKRSSPWEDITTLVMDKDGVERFRVSGHQCFYDGSEFEKYLDIFDIDRSELRKILKNYLNEKLEINCSLVF